MTDLEWLFIKERAYSIYSDWLLDEGRPQEANFYRQLPPDKYLILPPYNIGGYMTVEVGIHPCSYVDIYEYPSNKIYYIHSAQYEESYSILIEVRGKQTIYILSNIPVRSVTIDPENYPIIPNPYEPNY